MKYSNHKAAIILSLGLMTCLCVTKASAQTNDLLDNQTSVDMNTFISIFEIPATDISRAITFYQEILGIELDRIDFPEMQMGIFPYEGQMVTGVIVKGEGNQPSAEGITIYLNGGKDLQIILDRVEESGGQIIIPKTPHADESGFFALFLDSEGNKMGLHSPG